MVPQQLLLRANSSNSATSGCQSRSNSSNPYNCDRFIPFRGSTADNYYMEEYMLNNEDPFQAAAKKPKQVEPV